jgi:hypothetical protein
MRSLPLLLATATLIASGCWNSGEVLRMPLDGGRTHAISASYSSAFLVADRTGVYWADLDRQRIRHLPADGEAAVTVANADPRALATDGANLYWTAGQRIFRLAHAGGAPVVLAEIVQVWHLAAGGGNVCWIEDSREQVACVRASGGRATVVATGKLQTAHLAVDATHVYFTFFGGPAGERGIYRAPVGGGDRTLVAHDADIQDLHADDSGVCFSDAGGIFRLPAGEKTPVPIVTGRHGVRSFGVRRGYVYWIEAPGNVRQIYRAPLAGGGAGWLADSPDDQAPSYFAIGEGQVYWTVPHTSAWNS